MEDAVLIILATIMLALSIIPAFPFPSDKKRILKYYEKKGFIVTKLEWVFWGEKTHFHNIHTFHVIYKGNDGTIYSNYVYTSWRLGRILTDKEIVKYKKK